MAYNKAREERKWQISKQSEEEKLRLLGFKEEEILRLREYDWADFNSDRRYYQRLQETGTYINGVAESEQSEQSEMKNR